MDIFDLALALTPRVGGRIAAKLIEEFHSAEKIFSLTAEEIIHKTGLNERVAHSIAKREGFALAQEEMHYCEQHNIEIISLMDSDYPALLRESGDPPYILYLRGDRTLLNRNLISIIGTRRITPYGLNAISQMVDELSDQIKDLVVVSGLSYGVDAAAHNAALSSSTPTIAVLPTPLSKIYPADHENLASAIIERGGAIVSEYHSKSNNRGQGFNARARIIAGISYATIVGESSLRGGSLKCARIAFEENRVVLALPGRISDEMSRGCNALISQRMALPYLSPMSLIYELGWEDRILTESGASSPRESITLSEEQQAMLSLFEGDTVLHISKIDESLPFDIVKINTLLIELELLGVLRALPGANYQKLSL